MRRFLSLILILLTPFLLAASVQQQHKAVIARKNVAGGAACSPADDFDTDQLASLWTVDSGSNEGWRADVADNDLLYSSNSGSSSGPTERIIYTDCDIGSINHWGQVTITDVYRGSSYLGGGLILRRSGSTSPAYLVRVDDSADVDVAYMSDQITWDATLCGNIDMQFSDGDVLYASVTGTTTSTVITIKKNGAGTQTCDASGTWANYADTGNDVGIGAAVKYSEEGHFDDFTAGAL